MASKFVRVEGAQELAMFLETKVPLFFGSRVRKAMVDIVTWTKNRLREQIPVGGKTPALRDSIVTEVAERRGTMVGIVRPDWDVIDEGKVYAFELGRNPGTPPPFAGLIPWVERRLSIPDKQTERTAFAVAQSIGVKGSPPHFAFLNTANDAREYAIERIGRVIRVEIPETFREIATGYAAT